MSKNDMAIQYYKNSNPSYCPNCKFETKTFWNGSAACCEKCKRSYPEMAKECEKLGISSAGHWELCLNCNSTERWEERGPELRCVKCNKTLEEAKEVEKARPDRFVFSPEPHFNNEKIYLTCWLADASYPISFYIRWWGAKKGCITHHMISDEEPHYLKEFNFIKVGKTDFKVVLIFDVPFDDVIGAEIITSTNQAKRKKIRLNNQIKTDNVTLLERFKKIYIR